MKSKFKYAMSNEGLIAYNKEKPVTIRFNQTETDEILGKKVNYSKYDHYCEVAHLEISNRCNLHCPYCYVGEQKGKELTTDQWRHIIGNLADSGVFQCSIGGGEPTLREDLFELADYVSACGMNLGMTTNGTILGTLNPVLLKDYFKQINVSWHGDGKVVDDALYFLARNKIPCGINYCYSRDLSQWDGLVKHLARVYNAELLYLVYKPVIKDTEQQISPEDVYTAAKKAANEHLRVAVDGPCVNQCLMKRKFVDVDSLGNVYPCSFIRKPMGNLLKESFTSIWKKRGEKITCPYVKFSKKENCCAKE